MNGVRLTGPALFSRRLLCCRALGSQLFSTRTPSRHLPLFSSRSGMAHLQRTLALPLRSYLLNQPHSWQLGRVPASSIWSYALTPLQKTQWFSFHTDVTPHNTTNDLITRIGPLGRITAEITRRKATPKEIPDQFKTDGVNRWMLDINITDPHPHSGMSYANSSQPCSR